MNPIARKDLMSLLRSRSVLAAHLSYLAVLAIIFIASWPQDGMLTFAQRGKNDLQLTLMLAQITLLTLIVPASTAGAVAREREQNTLEMLQASRLHVGELIVGKLVASLAYPLMLLASGAPILAMLCFRGDLSPQQFGLSFGIVLATAVVLALLCLAVSSCCQATSTAMVISYVIVLFVNFVVLVPAAILLQSQSGDLAAALHYLRGISPVAGVLSILQPQPGDYDGTTHQLAASWVIFFAVSAVVSVLSVLFVSMRLRKRESIASREPAPRSRFGKILSVGFRSKTVKPMNSWNPLFSKERRTDLMRSGRWMTRSFFAGLTLSLLLALMSLYGGSEYSDLLGSTATVITALQLGLIALLSPSLTGAAVSSEVESGTLELLRLTPLTPAKHFSGKLFPALPTAILPIIAMLPAFAAVAFLNPAYVISIVRIYAISLLAVLMCCGVGLACSAWLQQSSRATLVAYLIVAAIFILPVFAWRASGSVLDPALARWIASLSPLVVAINILPSGETPVASMLTVSLCWLAGVFALSILIASAGLHRVLATGGTGWDSR